MARKPNQPVVIDEPKINHEAIDQAHADMNELARMNAEASNNAHALAEQFGYDGTLTVGALEDGIRFYQKRSVEACLELGKRLILLKELTPHGEFESRVELLGFSSRIARQFMSSTIKFSNRKSTSILSAAGTQTKLLELLVLDDSEIEELEQGKTVRGLDLDKIDTMSVRELKAALRDREADLEASRKRVSVKEVETERLTKELTKAKKHVESLTPDELGAELREEVAQLAFNAEAAILGNLTMGFAKLEEHAVENNCTHEEFMSGCLFSIERALVSLRNRFSVKAEPDGDERPDWTRPGAFESAVSTVAKLKVEAGHA